MLARGQGDAAGDYLSALLRPILEREWAKLVRRADQENEK
jgi:hypothetical protein